MRATVRTARLILHLCTGLVLSLLITFDLSRRIRPEGLTRWWNTRLLRILKVQVEVHGQGLAGPCLLICNHISWLDIPVIAANELTRFVSKVEVSRWPIAGWLANAAGTFYIRRGAGGTKQLIQAIAAHLSRGGSATVFPEGTTTEGEGLLKFQPRLFAAALDSGRPVQPLALRYARAANGENIAAFVGEQTLVQNLLRLLREPELRVELHYCTPIHPQATQDRASLARAVQDAVGAVISPGQPPVESSAAAPQLREWLAA